MEEILDALRRLSAAAEGAERSTWYSSGQDAESAAYRAIQSIADQVITELETRKEGRGE